MPHSYTTEQVTRFLSKVDQRGPSECWIWTGAKTKRGYGTFRKGLHRDEKPTTAHRAAWEIANGQEIPDGLLACHKCDNPTCVNPEHIFIGTHSDNTQDMLRKGRNRWIIPRGYKRDPETMKRGKDHPNYGQGHRIAGTLHYAARFTEDDIRAIRHARAAGMTFRAIADKFNTDVCAAFQIVNRKRYANVL